MHCDSGLKVFLVSKYADIRGLHNNIQTMVRLEVPGVLGRDRDPAFPDTLVFSSDTDNRLNGTASYLPIPR